MAGFQVTLIGRFWVIPEDEVFGAWHYVEAGSGRPGNQMIKTKLVADTVVEGLRPPPDTPAYR